MYDSFMVEMRCCLELESGLEESVCGKGTCGKYVLWAGLHKYAFSYYFVPFNPRGASVAMVMHFVPMS